ncbi:uncharacterized protein LOC124910662 [Impatiens glandulifera]|uniref:uncharacterized protein LOC124910662 n=1 Tax=Impatiens glandulifera TaxID=253017 RepID=UPI001FB15876|nr:uncharacterized protein LOC124910662 [Impatiens glandulifera]
MDPLTGWKFFASPTEISYLMAKCGQNESEQEKGADGSKTDQMCLKPESSENLETTKENNFSSEMENRNKNVYIERKKPDGLPPGWTKEIKVTTTNTGRVRKDPYYTDPATEYVFRSKKDALRYLETEDIYQCIMTPRKRDELKFLTDETLAIDEEDINSTKLKDYPNQETKVGNTFTSEQNEIVFDDDSQEKVFLLA